MEIVIGLLFVVAATVAYVALRNAQRFEDANEIVPGVATQAPKGWAGAHSTEAKLHRRLRDAVTALRSNAALDDPAMTGIRESIQDEALAVDERLIAVAALPGRTRDEPLADVERAVEAIETVVAEVVSLRGPALAGVEDGIERVRTRLRFVEEARRELQGLAAPSGAVGDLRDALGSDDAPTADDPAAGDTGDTDDPGSATSPT